MILPMGYFKSLPLADNNPTRVNIHPKQAVEFVAGYNELIHASMKSANPEYKKIDVERILVEHQKTGVQSTHIILTTAFDATLQKLGQLLNFRQCLKAGEKPDTLENMLKDMLEEGRLPNGKLFVSSRKGLNIVKRVLNQRKV